MRTEDSVQTIHALRSMVQELEQLRNEDRERRTAAIQHHLDVAFSHLRTAQRLMAEEPQGA